MIFGFKKKYPEIAVIGTAGPFQKALIMIVVELQQKRSFNGR